MAMQAPQPRLFLYNMHVYNKHIYLHEILGTHGQGFHGPTQKYKTKASRTKLIDVILRHARGFGKQYYLCQLF